MILYISGASSEHKRAAALEAALAGNPISVSDRWWRDAASWTGRDGEHTPDERRRITRHHFANIEQADVFWLLVPSPGHYSRGAWAETGFAQAQSRALTIVVSGERFLDSVFTSLTDRQFLTDDEALAYVLDLARKS